MADSPDSGEELLQFLYLCPVGVAKIDAEGTIEMLNAIGTQLLIPLWGDARMGSLYDALAPHGGAVRDRVISFPNPHGEIIRGERFAIRRPAMPRPVVLELTVIKTGPTSFMATLSDVTAIVEQEQRVREALAAEALQRGRLEIATGVLHDIGNATTSLGTRSARQLADAEWAEVAQLERLRALFQSESAALASALGEGRAGALSKFVDQLAKTLRARQDNVHETSQQLTRTVAHIQQILNIQRTYAGFGSLPRQRLRLSEIVGDALMIQKHGLERRGVQVETEIASGVPYIRGDRTKLVQVTLNVLKNACEAFDRTGADADPERRITIALSTVDDARARLTIADNACGFEPERAAALLERGESGRAGGQGLGLATCKKLVEMHDGSFMIMSEGPGRGATVVLELPLQDQGNG